MTILIFYQKMKNQIKKIMIIIKIKIKMKLKK